MRFSSLVISNFLLVSLHHHPQRGCFHASAFRAGIPLTTVLEGHRRFVQSALEYDNGNAQQPITTTTALPMMMMRRDPNSIITSTTNSNTLMRSRRRILPVATTNLLHHGSTFVMTSSQQQQHSSTIRGNGGGALHMASEAAAAASANNNAEAAEFTPEEISFLDETFATSLHDAKALTQSLVEQLPTMPASLILKLKQAQGDAHETVRAVATALNAVMDAQLEEARDLLKDLLEAGEIRKMDALIGKAARGGQLDAAFFTVLQMNLQAATQEAIVEDNAEASRVQILQHVYTRCQEEVEKNIPPGIALLNKLLRTEVDSIRANQLKHYLCPQPNVITSPDGQEIELKGGERVLVEPALLVDAIGKAVKQIRTVEQAGGTDRAQAAGMVESCRQVAKEARMVLGEQYGQESEEVLAFEDGLQPVFRPESPESPYIKGE